MQLLEFLISNGAKRVDLTPVDMHSIFGACIALEIALANGSGISNAIKMYLMLLSPELKASVKDYVKLIFMTPVCFALRASLMQSQDVESILQVPIEKAIEFAKNIFSKLYKAS